MKICISIPTLHDGGAERVLLNLLKYVDHEKYDIVVVTLFKPEEIPDINGVRFYYVFPRKFRGNVHLLKLFSPETLYKWILGRYKADVVVSYLQSPTMRIVAGCRDGNVKLVNWIHNEFRDIGKLSSMFRSEKEFHRCMQRYDHTVFVAESARQILVEKLPYLEEKSSTIYNVVESDVIREKADEPINDVVFSENVTNLVAVGRFAKAKAFDVLIRCVGRLKAENIQTHLYLLGKGDEEILYRKLISDMDLEDEVTIVGFRSNPYKYVKASDLFVCSSVHEGYSTAVTESLIVGTPVITTLCSGMEELLGKNGEYGIITENDEEAFYTGLRTLLTTSGALAELKVKAEKRGMDFTKEKCVSDVENLFDEVVIKTVQK